LNKLLLIPLTALVILAILSMCGLGSANFNYNTSIGESQVYYDSNGHAVIFGNGTIAGEFGSIYNDADLAYWSNATGEYCLYLDQTGVDPLLFADFGKSGGISIDLGSSLGLLGLLMGVMALAVVSGLTIFGTGTSDSSVNIVVTCTAYLAVWGVFSALTLNLLMGFDSYGWLIYFTLTIMYTLGIIQSFTNSGGS